ncbi:MAG: cytidine deaminase [Bacteroidia bacterium]|nr:cytidine deaminase [Bacteroidia bacterium]
MITKNDIIFKYKEFDTDEELDAADRELLNAAKKVVMNAYAPYSQFKVGAAVRLESGKIVLGTNVENAAFPSGICAERSALSNASSNYPGDKPVALAIAALNESGLTTDPVSPCGNCRQVIAEEEYRNGNNIRIILKGKNKIRMIEKGGDLLPLQFNMKNLKVNPH